MAVTWSDKGTAIVGYMGKVAVMRVFYDPCLPTHASEKYGIDSMLPGFRDSGKRFETASIAMHKAEKLANEWIAKAGLAFIPSQPSY